MCVYAKPMLKLGVWWPRGDIVRIVQGDAVSTVPRHLYLNWRTGCEQINGTDGQRKRARPPVQMIHVIADPSNAILLLIR